MKNGEKVRVKSFFLTKNPEEETDEKYNYWKLIGEKGIVINKRKEHPFYKNRGEQVLVKFEKNLQSLGLVSHNDKENSLWFFLDDIEKL